MIPNEIHSATVIKSSSDSRVYRYLKLDNALSVVLVHDSEADKAAAAIDVAVGSFVDQLQVVRVFFYSSTNLMNLSIVTSISICEKLLLSNWLIGYNLWWQGSYEDPEELPGLAHMCEHMLFLGTEKYPKENEYSSFLQQHGGSSNAFTSACHTNYFFEVGAE